jgi:hypothetical protein
VSGSFLTTLKELIDGALQEAFDAGCEYGGDEATAYEWGAPPPLQRKRGAIEDLTADWNDGPCRKLIAHADIIEELVECLQKIAEHDDQHEPEYSRDEMVRFAFAALSKLERK